MSKGSSDHYSRGELEIGRNLPPQFTRVIRDSDRQNCSSHWNSRGFLVIQDISRIIQDMTGGGGSSDQNSREFLRIGDIISLIHSFILKHKGKTLS